MDDPLYFCKTYIKIVSLDEGLVPFDVYPFQKEMLGTIHNNRFTICKPPDNLVRQLQLYLISCTTFYLTNR